MDIKDIIERAGGPTAVSGYCGIKKQAPGQWKKVPAEQVLKIFHGSSGAVTPHEMRPDIYPDPQWMPSLDSESAA